MGAIGQELDAVAPSSFGPLEEDFSEFPCNLLHSECFLAVSFKNEAACRTEATSAFIPSPAHSREGANFVCSVYQRQPVNSAKYAFIGAKMASNSGERKEMTFL